MTGSTTSNRRSVRGNAFGAVLIASAVAGLAAWLLLRPVREPARLTPVEPRPEFLDKPYRQLPVLAPPVPSSAR